MFELNIHSDSYKGCLFHSISADWVWPCNTMHCWLTVSQRKSWWAGPAIRSSKSGFLWQCLGNMILPFPKQFRLVLHWCGGIVPSKWGTWIMSWLKTDMEGALFLLSLLLILRQCDFCNNVHFLVCHSGLGSCTAAFSLNMPDQQFRSNLSYMWL